MASNYITLKIDSARATIALNRPDQHNKLGVEELDTLVATLDHVENFSDCRVLVLTGTGSKTFCSGFDLGQISTTDWTLDPFERAVTRLEQLPIPTICALNGSVYGGGTELALACEFRIGIKPGFPRWMTNLMTCFADSAIRINAIPSALRANPMSPGG